MSKKINKLSAERQEKLNSIGFVWIIRSTGQTDWNTRFEQLVEYKQVNGHCNVPRHYGPSLDLSSWVAVQRVVKKKNKLSAERVEKLNSIGFVWKRMSLTDWDTRLEQLVEYYQIHGDFNVSRKKSKDIQLGRWVGKQREAKEKFRLSEERQQKLNAIGFVWNKVFSKGDWDVHFRELLSYFQTHGDFNVTQCHPRNPLLASWVTEQRNEYELRRRAKQTSMTPLREAKLDAIGFTWIVGGTEEEAPPVECVSSGST
jgi:hypothetical protein